MKEAQTVTCRLIFDQNSGPERQRERETERERERENAATATRPIKVKSLWAQAFYKIPSEPENPRSCHLAVN